MDGEIRKIVSDALSRELLTPSEVAAVLGVSKASVTNFVQRGFLIPIKTTEKGSNLFLRSEIELYKAYRRKPEMYHDHLRLQISAPVLAALDLDILRNLDSADFLVGYSQLNASNQKIAHTAIDAVISALLEQQSFAESCE